MGKLKLTNDGILRKIDTARSLAVEGLNYSNNSYDRERYAQLLEIVSSLYGCYLDQAPEKFMDKFIKELGSCTPKVGVNVAVRSKRERLLVLRRSDDKTWCLPCGWVGVGEAMDDAAARGTLEETGLRIQLHGVIDLMEKMPTVSSTLHHQVNPLYISHPINELSVILSAEHIDFAWVTDTSGREWHPGHLEHAGCALAFIAGARSVIEIGRYLVK